LYGDTPSAPGKFASPAPPDLSGFPESLRSNFLQACAEADYDRLIDLCDELGTSAPALAQQLRTKLNVFDYDSIKQLIAATSSGT
jgi:hypothetical protein